MYKAKYDASKAAVEYAEQDLKELFADRPGTLDNEVINCTESLPPAVHSMAPFRKRPQINLRTQSPSISTRPYDTICGESSVRRHKQQYGDGELSVYTDNDFINDFCS